MTKEQAAKILRQGSKMAWDAEEFCKAYDMAIQALEENKQLTKTLNRMKKQLRVMKSCKSIDITGQVLETGKFLCAYHALLEELRNN